jgi:hypothetical protein
MLTLGSIWDHAVTAARLLAVRRPAPAPHHPARRSRPGIEELENRLVPATYSFSSLQDALNQFTQTAMQGFPSSAACQQGLQDVYNAVVQYTQDNIPDELPLVQSELAPLLQQAPQTCARFDQHGSPGSSGGHHGKNPGGKGTQPSRLHADTALGNQLLLLEGTLRVNGLMTGADATIGSFRNFAQGTWFWQQGPFISHVEHATSPAALGRLMVQLEGSISRSAFDAAWPGLEASWKASVVRTKTMQGQLQLLQQLKAHLRLQSITGQWRPYADWPGALGPTHVPPPIPGQ